MRYVESCYKKQRQELAYRIYVTDAFKLIGKLNLRFIDIIKPPVEMTEEEQQEKAEETKNRIFAKLNGNGG